MSYLPYLNKFIDDTGMNGRRFAKFCGVSKDVIYRMIDGTDIEKTSKLTIDRILSATFMPYEILFSEKVSEARTKAYQRCLERSREKCGSF